MAQELRFSVDVKDVGPVRAQSSHDVFLPVSFGPIQGYFSCSSVPPGEPGEACA